MTLKGISSGLVKNIKKLNKRTKSAFFQIIYSQLDEINETNPKLFWKTIDKIKKCGKTPQQKAIKKDKWIPCNSNFSQFEIHSFSPN
jgi:hypothetical protein